MNGIKLKCSSREAWIECVKNDFDSFMADHADCERKAAATSMALISRFPDKPEVVEPMISLAREELSHFRTMYKILKSRGVTFNANQNDPYIQLLTKEIRHPQKQYFLDRLLVAGIIEQRASERLDAITPHIEEPALRSVYRKLADEEKAHGSIFVKLARKFFEDEEIESRLTELVSAEARITQSIAIRPAIH